MISSKIIRMLTYKPLGDLQFEQGKSLIMKTDSKGNLLPYGNYFVIGATGLMAYRIISNYASMSTLNFIFSSFVLLGSGILSNSWLNFSQNFVKEIYLMKSGKYIEITNFGLTNTKKKVKISDILNPEENLQTKLKMQVFGSWVIETKQGDSFVVIQDSHAYHKDVLKHILQGINIEVNSQDDEKDIIDI